MWRQWRRRRRNSIHRIGVILFCTATGIDHAAVGIPARAMQSMAIRGFIVHDRESGAYALTDSGRAPLAVIFENAGLAPK
jgi:hypothetical protein